MINLLPDNTKKQISSARINVNLISYIITLLFAVVFLSAVCFVSYLILADSKATAEKTISNNQSSATVVTSSLDTQINTINTNFSIAKSIFDKRVSYSDTIMSLGSAMPAGTIIESLSLESSNMNSVIAIKARAKTAEVVTTLRSNLQNSTIFSNSNVGNASNTQNDKTGYPFEFDITLTVRRTAQ